MQVVTAMRVMNQAARHMHFQALVHSKRIAQNINLLVPSGLVLVRGVLHAK